MPCCLLRSPSPLQHGDREPQRLRVGVPVRPSPCPHMHQLLLSSDLLTSAMNLAFLPSPAGGAWTLHTSPSPMSLPPWPRLPALSLVRRAFCTFLGLLCTWPLFSVRSGWRPFSLSSLALRSPLPLWSSHSDSSI